ncbi:GIY-YIG nuclease family protein [Enterovibrio paralichthyis]|uniref:GIY-YIG nuclease family protein n=1 Tax=Enterovibrio paralichthyis TaxID=2853805 RepID=UPI001C47E7AD|nr:GIY-YIG nuclease family protein [Enterovibrio paralichthyis]MBV7296574.1 GIY-YIG nuclease family protein [Enterovibrio paralichthyis]
MTSHPSGDVPDTIQPWYVYLIRTRDDALYCGVTTDVARRFSEHQDNGTKTAKYLRGKQPLTLAWSFQAASKQQAMSLEWKIKRLTKRDKERLCNDSDRITVLLNDN